MLAHAPASTIEKDMDLAQALAAATGVRCRTLDVTADFFTAVGATAFRDLPYPRSCELLAFLRIGREGSVAREGSGAGEGSGVGEGSA
jgi:hypothetical protein